MYISKKMSFVQGLSKTVDKMQNRIYNNSKSTMKIKAVIMNEY